MLLWEKHIGNNRTSSKVSMNQTTISQKHLFQTVNLTHEAVTIKSIRFNPAARSTVCSLPPNDTAQRNQYKLLFGTQNFLFVLGSLFIPRIVTDL